MRARARLSARKIFERKSLLGIPLGALVTVLAGASFVVSGPLTASRGASAEGVNMALYGAPVQTGAAGPDSPTSFNATLPNGRRITPAGSSVQVGENPLGAALTADGKYLVVSNDDERNGKSINTKYSQAAVNGAGKVPGGFVLSVVRTADMQVVSSATAPTNTVLHPGPKTPGKSQDDNANGLFLGIVVKPGASGTATVYAAGGYSNLVDVYSLAADGTLTQSATISIPVPADPLKPNFGMAMPGGLALSPDGSKLFVVNNNANNVVTVDTATNAVVGQPASVGYFPYSALPSPDGTKLYVSNWGVADRSFNAAYRSSYDAATRTGTGSPYIGGVTGHLFASPATDLGRTSSVSILPLNGAKLPVSWVSVTKPIDGKNIVGGTHPSALASATRGQQSVLYVANANEDAIAVIDTKTDDYLGKFYLPQPVGQSGEVNNPDNRTLGLIPNALAVSPDNTRLFVAEAGLNSVAVYDTANPVRPHFLGRIPTGWFPTALNLSPDGASLYITNAKGLGSDYGFQGQVNGAPDVNLLFGTVQKVALQGLDLGAATTQVQQNTVAMMSSAGFTALAGARAHIQHVIFVLRENKSYDSYFGNDAVLNARGANGKPEYATYDPQVPNTKALAEQFAVGDNSYADSEESNAGHQFALTGGTTDYSQKTLLERFSRFFMNTKNEDPEDYPLMGYIFNHAARNGVPYRNYGDMLRLSGFDEGANPNHCADDPYPGCDNSTYSYKNTTAPTAGLGGLYTEDIPALAALGDNHTDLLYPGWNLNISDQRRVLEFERDFGPLAASGQAPAFTFVWLPDDHTGGGLDPKFEVADNDAALGQLVDFVSHSRIWNSTAIFVTEDDAQGSADHVNAHRSYTLAISPWVKHRSVSHRLSSTVSITKTVEELLGMPAMNLGDLLANDLSDYFTSTPDFTPYSARPQASTGSTPALALRVALLSSRLDSKSYDRDNTRLGQIDFLYSRSLSLAAHHRGMSAATYRIAQDRIYRNALAVVNGRSEPSR